MATKRELIDALDNNPNVKKMLDIIAASEGVKLGYNTGFGNEKITDLSKHPNQKKSFTETTGNKNKTTAAGRYQFLNPTWNGVASQFDLKDFSPRNQDIGAVALLAENGALPYVLKGDFKTAVAKSGGTWASFPTSKAPQNKRSWAEIEKMIGGSIKNPDRGSDLSKIDRLVAEHKKLVEGTKPKQVSQEQRNARINSLVNAFDAANPNRTAPSEGLPDFDAQGNFVPESKMPIELPKPTQDRTLAQRALGALETGATLASGTIGAPIGQALGTFRGAAQAIIDGEFGTQQGAQNILNAANQGAEALTYQPQTAAGQEYVQNVGEAIQNTGLDTLPPVMGGLGVATGTLGKASIPTVTNTARDLAQAAKPAVAQAVEAIQTPIQATTNAISSGANRVAEAVGLREPQATPDLGASVGASQVTQPQLRQALAQDLPVPVGDLLTEGQLSRDPMQLKFEVETAKQEVGTPLRQRYEQQHAAVNANLDKFFESTGAEKITPREIGLAIDDAMQKELAKDKARTRAAYKKAEKSDEARTVVDLTRPVSGVLEDGDTTLINYLNDQVSGVTEPILDSAKKLAVKRGLAVEEDGVLVPLSATIKQMEDFRKDIVAKTDSKSAPDIRQSTIIKNLIDGQTEPYEGNLYRNARQLRREQAQKWESNTIIKNLTNLKRGTEDRMIALEDITDKVINKGSYDDLNQVRKTLLSSGDEGKQAWKELQGATIRQIHDAATAGVAPDANGNQMISPAALNKQIRNLEADNKLDLIFDRETADKLRALNEVSKTLFTVPASAAINHSNTASAIQVAIDLAASAATGLPAPVATALKLATNHIKDRKIKARVNKALRLNERGNF